MDTVTVHLSHSFPLMISGIDEAIKKNVNVVLLGVSSDIQETMYMCQAQKPKLLLVDRELLGIKIQKFLNYFNKNFPYMSIILFVQNLYESVLYESPDLCVAGYLLNSVSEENLIQAIVTVGHGGVWYNQHFMQKIFTNLSSMDKLDGMYSLTRRERQILILIGKGWTNSRISNYLHLSKQTVNNYICNIYSKLNIKSRPEAVLLAHDLNLAV